MRTIGHVTEELLGLLLLGCDFFPCALRWVGSAVISLAKATEEERMARGKGPLIYCSTALTFTLGNGE